MYDDFFLCLSLGLRGYNSRNIRLQYAEAKERAKKTAEEVFEQ